MLKIKDNVDLKELEKFGFKRAYFAEECVYIKEYKLGTHYEGCVVIWKKDKLIQVEGIVLLNTLYDLIQQGYVEKVEE